MIDMATRYQVAGVLQKKSTEDVLKFMAESWFQTLGVPPLTWALSSLPMSFHGRWISPTSRSTMCLSRRVAEQAGGSLKAVLRVLIHQQSVAGEYELKLALAAAVEAVNNDIDQTGFSPAQIVLGKQLRIVGVADPSNVRSRLAFNSMLLQELQFERILASKECARMGMVKLHYSRALREASVARPRAQPDYSMFSVGDVVCFYRMQKPVAKKYKHVQRKRLALKRWHGPAVILAIEGSPSSVPISAYVAYRGNVTKVAMEHLRHARAFERLVAEDWDPVVQDVMNSVDPDGGGPSDGAELPPLDVGQRRDDQGVPIPEPTLPMLPEHRPVVQQQVVFPYPHPASLMPMSVAAPSMSAASKLSSRRSSTTSSQPTEQAVPAESKPAPPLPREIPVPADESAGEDLQHAEVPQQPAQPEQAALQPERDLQAGGTALGLPDHPRLHDPQPAEVQRGERLERAKTAVRRALSEGAEVREAKRRAFAPITLGNKTIDVMNAEAAQLHPLVQAVTWAEEDKLQGLIWERDHGTWDGRWPQPSSFDFEAMEASTWLLPTGGA